MDNNNQQQTSSGIPTNGRIKASHLIVTPQKAPAETTAPVDKRIFVKSKQTPVNTLDLKPKFQPFTQAQASNINYEQIRKVVIRPKEQSVVPVVDPVDQAQPAQKGNSCRSCESMQEFVANLQYEIKRLQYITSDLQKQLIQCGGSLDHIQPQTFKNLCPNCQKQKTQRPGSATLRMQETKKIRSNPGELQQQPPQLMKLLSDQPEPVTRKVGMLAPLPKTVKMTSNQF